MVVMQVAGLTLDEQTKAPILVLKSAQGNETLPIWIGAMEAMAISVVINAVSVPRPLTHDLMLSTIRKLGAKLIGIEIMDLRDGTYFAELDILASGVRHRVDCRPSDGIALALRAGVPILVRQSVLDAAATDNLRPSNSKPAHLIEPADAATEMLRKAESARARSEGSEGVDEGPDEETLKELLKHLEPDTKTKM
ncbi:bifunctional nuclease family protein [Desulfovibrio mangrovi]|uniref:bifunctional nuclease family protein n=1 Tax=Desulfovibrio mangrovi TaxID=2976983 RepID=UPI0022461D1A|nr:bifunctional nuclease family protein [Desulfovibrio mangrovi]UZP68691.1 bifunctional nuclease family protein [Desulfovibrio mangrovi]